MKGHVNEACVWSDEVRPGSGSLTQCFSAGREAAEHKDVIRRDRSEGVPRAAGRTVLRNAPETTQASDDPPTEKRHRRSKH